MKPVKICILDNYLLTRVAYKKYFELNKNYKIIGDFSSFEALFLNINSLNPDIVIMCLSDIKCFEFIKIIKQKNPKTKIIVLTNKLTYEYIITSLNFGANGCVDKNKFKKDIKKVISLVLSGMFFLDIETAFSAFSNIPQFKGSSELENIESLTDRELEVLKHMIDGKTNTQIAKEMIVSRNTAKAHVGSILSKLKVNDRVQAVVKAIKGNLI